MSTQHWKGPTVPVVGDDLLEAWSNARTVNIQDYWVNVEHA